MNLLLLNLQQVDWVMQDVNNVKALIAAVAY
jgi:hypothetical protein